MYGPSLDAEIQVHYGKRVVTAAVSYHGVTLIGESRCHPDDWPNADVGRRIAVSRAFQAHADRMMSTTELLKITGDRILVKTIANDSDDYHDELFFDVPGRP